MTGSQDIVVLRLKSMFIELKEIIFIVKNLIIQASHVINIKHLCRIDREAYIGTRAKIRKNSQNLFSLYFHEIS